MLAQKNVEFRIINGLSLRESPTVNQLIDPKLNKVLLALLGSQDFVNTWWTSPNLGFGLKTPETAYFENPEKVSEYLGVYAVCEGS